MFRPSRRAVVFAASFALAFASVAPSAHAGRSDDDDTEEQSDALLGLIDITDLLGGLPLLGGGFDESSLPTIEGIGLPTLEALGLPGLEGLGLPALEGLGLPALEGLGLPALDGLGLGGLGLDGIGLAGLPLGDVLSLGGVGGSSTGLPLGILDVLSGPGLDLHVLVEVGLTGAASQL